MITLFEQSYLENVIVNAPIGIVTTDMECRVTLMNELARGLFCMDGRKDPAGMQLETLVSNPDLVTRSLRRVLEYEEERLIFETEIARGGAQTVSRFTVTLLRDDNFTPMGLLIMCEDVTEQRQLQRELQRKNEELERFSITDYLTGLYNHRHFHTEIRSEITRARRYGVPLALLMLDIDMFKRYNDAYGHQKGDEVLTCIGRIVRGTIRGGVDSAYRYGGEELAVILPMTKLEAARDVAERIRAAVEIESGVTVSIGVAELQPKDTAETLTKRADDMLYRAKDDGRNLVCCTRTV